MGPPDQWQQAAGTVAAGIVLLAASGAGIVRARRFLDGAQRAEARVVDLEKHRQGVPGCGVKTTIYHPIVTFTTLEGAEITATTRSLVCSASLAWSSS